MFAELREPEEVFLLQGGSEGVLQLVQPSRTGAGLFFSPSLSSSPSFHQVSGVPLAILKALSIPRF